MLYTPDNYRNLVIEKDDYLHVDEDKIDIYSYKKFDIPEWIPRKVIKPYSEATIAIFDIESTGLDPRVDRIMMIGLINEKGQSIILEDEDEDIMLLKFLKILEIKKPNIIAHYNGFSFDLPFIIHRLKVHNIKNPFYISSQPKTHRQAILFNKSQKYTNVYYKGSAIIDLYNQVLVKDNVDRILTKRTLKAVSLQWGLRDKERLDLSYSEMLECYKNWGTWGRDRVREYLIYDLEDSKMIADRLIPSIWYQQKFLDWSLQSISSSGTGSKWNSIIENYYGLSFNSTPDLKKNFEGGLTGSIPGLYRNVFKVDVSSLYPSIMLLYGIHSYKDPNKFQLEVLKYMKDHRIELKKIAKKDPEANALQASLKILINSSYGALSTKGLPMNDYVAGALVTAYGRAILKRMIKSCKDNGGLPVSMDTDGIYYASNDKDHGLSIYKQMQIDMPESIELELETQADIFYVPPNKTDYGVGLRKNYIYIENGKLKYNGKYRKRDKSELERSFQPKLIQIYFNKGEREANDYYRSIIRDLQLGKYDKSKISIKRKIKSNEVTLIELGFGEPGDEVEYMIGLDRVGGKGKRYYKPVPLNAEYDAYYYTEMIVEQFRQVRRYF